MLDFENLQQYRENNRIEAKEALGGLPESLWETYSAFANSEGGIILLGVEELPDKTLHALDLLDPKWLLEDFWKIINDPELVSVNILTAEHVQLHIVDGKRIIAITVPKADAGVRPVYIGNDPYRGSFRRCGEGDYRCTKEEIDAMLAKRSQNDLSWGCEATDYIVKTTAEEAQDYLTKMVGQPLQYALKSPDVDLYDFGFGDLIQTTNSRGMPHRVGSYTIHAQCPLKVIWKNGTKRVELYEGDADSQKFHEEIRPLIGQRVKRVTLSDKNDLWLDLGDYWIVFITWEDNEESWRFFLTRKEDPHLVASNQWLQLHP